MYSLGFQSPAQRGGTLIDTAARIIERQAAVGAGGTWYGPAEDRPEVFIHPEDPGSGELPTWGDGEPITLAPIEVEVSRAGIPGPGLFLGLALVGIFLGRARAANRDLRYAQSRRREMSRRRRGV